MIKVLIAASLGVPGGMIFAQAAQPAADPDPLQLYAPLGVFAIVCIVLTWVWQKAEKRADAERTSKDAAENRERIEVAAANARERATIEKYAEKLERATQIAADMAGTLKDTQRAQAVVAAQVDPNRVDQRLEAAMRQVAEVVRAEVREGRQ